MSSGIFKRNHFWAFARALLDHKRTIAAAITFAVISAAGLGVGIVGIVLAFEQVLRPTEGERTTLADSIREGADKLPLNIAIPDPWLDALPTDPYRTLVALVIALGILTMLGAFANFLHLYFSMTLCTRTVADVRRRAFEHILGSPLLGQVSRNAADSVSRIVQDAAVLERGFRALTSKALAQITKGFAALVVAFALNWKLALATMLVAPVLGVIVRKLGKRIKRASRGAMRGRSELLSTATEVFQGFRVVKVYGAEQRELDRFEDANRRVVQQELRARVARAVATPLVEFLALLVVGTLALVAGKAIIDGNLEIEEAAGVLGALALAGNALKPLTNVLQDIQTADAAAQRLALVVNAPVERPANNAPPVPRLARDITFDGVTFTYPDKESPALNGITLTIPARTTTAFVGPNGCGKTTLLSLVPALFRPDSGRVLIDGLDLADADLATLRAQIGVVTQEVVLFQGTIADNIRYSKPDATDADIEDALRRAHADDFISNLPDGIHTQVGDRGMSLSGGQRQRLAIARAILRDPAILIMDEATSMIDADSEAKITAAMREFGSSRTVLTVAHRLSTVRHADTIVVMNMGRVEATGTHDELLDSSPLYRQLASHQLAPAPTA